MASGIDMTLDDLIKKNKQSKPSTRVRNRPSVTAPGPARRNFKRKAARPAPYSITPQAEAPEGTWQHDLFASHEVPYPAQVARASAIETGTKLYLSNLDYGVSNEDIKELFAEVGDIKRCGVHYDRSGRSKGTADVVFSRRADALAAVKRYNNVQLDGKPMKIEIVGTNIATPAPVPASFGGSGNQNGATRSQASSSQKSVQGRGRGSGRARVGARGARRGRDGGGRGKGPGEKEVSLEDLDAELEKYHASAMETS